MPSMSFTAFHTMMDYPLTLTALLERAGRYATNVEIVSRLPDRSLHSYTWGELYHPPLSLAESLLSIGLKKGERVAQLMWNLNAHLECFFVLHAAVGVMHSGKW